MDIGTERNKSMLNMELSLLIGQFGNDDVLLIGE